MAEQSSAFCGTDPARHPGHLCLGSAQPFSHYVFAIRATDFSLWCETLSLAATGDPDLVRQFAEIVRRECVAVGIPVALHPQIDLATEPRWSRITGTFGEDARLTAGLATAHIEGFQGSTLGPGSVACMTKHVPGGYFDYHLIPFEAAFAANSAAVMPYYGVPMGQTDEDVAMSFNKAISTGLLRGRFHYVGVVCTDWGLITDTHLPGAIWAARAWGASTSAGACGWARRSMPASISFRGELPGARGRNGKDGTGIRSAAGPIHEAAIAPQVRIGLLDNPFVDETSVAQVFGHPASARAGVTSQTRAMPLLKNAVGVLPLRGRPKV